MNKKLLALTTALLLIIPTSAHAGLKNAGTVVPTLAILDTAIDTSIPMFSGKIVNEVCILDWNSCPNGKNFMEGPGAAGLPSKIISANGFDHGTQMTSVAIQTNSNINIVFIRIIGNTAAGVRQTTTSYTVGNALNWVIANKDKWNIQAVAMSQSANNFYPGANYCPVMVTAQSAIKKLMDLGVPSLFAAGNDRDYTHVNSPACIPESIAVGATDQYGQIATYSNYDSKLLDFYALGNVQVTAPGNKVTWGAGTSVATQVAAAGWIAIKNAKPTLTYQQIYDLIIKTSTPAVSAKLPTGKQINIQGAING
jgi:hypothetical protein